MDPGSGKGVLIKQFDLSRHELSEEFELFGKLPWTSMVISDRILVVDDFNFSMNTAFFW